MTAAALARRAALLVAAWLLGGCALLQPPKPQTPEDAAGALQPAYRLEIDAPAPLATLLRNHLDLARFQQSPQAERITDTELDRLAAATPAQARSLLETEGHFSAVVQVQREPVAEGELPLLRVRVDPGPVAVVESLRLTTSGALRTEANAREADAVELVRELRDQWPLKPGEVFRQSLWTDAKNRALVRLRAEGYPTARWRETQARVDAEAATVALSGTYVSGPRFHLGPLNIEGLERHRANTVTRLAGFSPGTPYTEKRLLDFQDRLLKIGLFEGATVELDPAPATAAAAPVNVRVRELPLQQATAGVGVSANTGPRVTFEHVHRKPFGQPWIAKNQLELGSERSAWRGDLISHPVPGLYRNLASGNFERLRSGEELRRTWSARLGRTQDTERLERLYFAEVTQVRLINPVGDTRNQAVSANYHWVWRDIDSVLLPTEGQTFSAQVGAGLARANVQENGPFGRLEARLTLYRTIGKLWYATGRIEAGQVLARRETGVPDTLLFRAGGDESVRGYDYRALGPTVDGVTVSGRALLTASAELARPISLKMPSLWGAVFVDAGNAADSFGNLKPVFGIGTGVRWRSPVGPLRVDLAWGEAARQLRLHLSVGIAF